MMHSVACNHGRQFGFALGSTALVVIDMQRDFLDPLGMVAQGGDSIATLRRAIPKVGAALEAARQSGLRVIHTREGYAPDLSDMHELKRARRTGRSSGPLGKFLIRGEAGQAIVDELAPWPDEVVFDKPGFGAFYRTELEQHLRAEGLSHLVLCGVTTQCCVHSTLREAVDRGFRCLTLEDACAAVTPELHDAAMSLIYGEAHLFGWVSTSDAFAGALAGTANE